MVIKASSAREISRLLDDLENGPSTQRESAVARLAVIGPRAVTRLIAVLTGTPSTEVTLAVLTVLEAIGDGRALGPGLSRVDDPNPTVSAAAVGVVRSHLLSDDVKTAAAALDQLTAVALDPSRDDAPRLAAIDALEQMPADMIEPLVARLQQDSSTGVRRRAKTRGRQLAPPEPVDLVSATNGALPDDAAAVRALVTAEAASAPLSTLHRLLGVIREHEQRVSPPARLEWTAARAALHRALAARGSRIALYDVRETIAASESALPLGFLAAIATIGDASCLEPLAAAYARTQASGEDWWRRHLADAFRQIVERARLTRRHGVIRRIVSRWPHVADDLLGPRRAPRPSGRRKADAKDRSASPRLV